MPAHRSLNNPATNALPGARRLFGLWWRRQSPARQDRLATLAPLISVLLFLAAIISAFWYLRNEEIERETESVKRDTEITQQQINLRLIQNQEQLTRMARELVTREVDQVAFAALAADFARERPEVRHLNWLGARRNLKATHYPLLYLPESLTGPASPDPSLPQAGRDNEPEQAFRTAWETRQPTYTGHFTSASGQPVFQLYLPLIERNEIGSVKDILATIKERQMGYGLIVRVLNDFTKWVGEHDISTAKRLAEIGPDYLEAKRQQL